MSTHIKAGTATNLRDLGGTPVRGGGEIARGKLLRAEAMVQPGASTVCAIFDESHGDAYRALGIRTVIDLRSSREQAEAPSAWIVPSGARLESIPIDEGVEGDTNYLRQIQEGLLLDFSADDLADHYSAILRRRSRVFGTAVRVCATLDRLPVLVHCAAGKDRTGLLVALLLEVIGVARDHVVADYALTGVLRPDRVAAYAPIFEGSGVDPLRVAAVFESPPEAMRKALAGLDSEYGSVSQYLTTMCGVSSEEIESLRVAMLTR